MPTLIHHKGESMKKLIPLLIASSLALTACPVIEPPKPAQVRFVHASTDAGTVDLYLNKTNKLTTAPLAVKTTLPATGYSPQTAGTPKLDVCAAGSVLCPIKDKDITLVSDKNQTVFIIGSGAGTGATALDTVVIQDNNTAPSAQTNFRLRIVNASVGNDALNVYITAPTDPINSVLPAQLSYKTASTYLEKTVASYRIRVTTTGSTTPIIDTNTSLAFAGGKVYTFVLVGPNPDGALLTDN